MQEYKRYFEKEWVHMRERGEKKKEKREKKREWKVPNTNAY